MEEGRVREEREREKDKRLKARVMQCWAARRRWEEGLKRQVDSKREREKQENNSVRSAELDSHRDARSDTRSLETTRAD